ncbi:(2Fe-2S)-binding protein [Opitutia bacterium ISCC 51]|nr:(2Fe-2S)-binding protein [Opitutae bacterium ISCC 51]QXD29740.1 (2Fe-2S)-binding protein [Opitutae bacterium ISCC 52]
MHSISLNGKTYQLDVPDDMPLLWAIRDVLGFSGTKFGCGLGQCGACTMHLDGEPIRSCITPITDAKGKQITTIEGIGDDSTGKKVQEAWVEEGVPQCGYCQSGQVMSATALLQSNPNPSDEAIEGAMTGNICRCGTYNRIKTAIHSASSKIKEGSK